MTIQKPLIESVFQRSLPVIERVKTLLLQYHTTYNKNLFGHVSRAVKPSVLRHFYKELTGDSSNLKEKEIDQQLTLVLEPSAFINLSRY